MQHELRTVAIDLAKKVFHESLLLDSRVLRDQERNERRQQRFASLAGRVPPTCG